MNSSNKQAVKVGIFIFIGLLIFIVGILTIGSMRKSFVKKIEAKAVFGNVDGLQKGNNVWFSGVKVGTVKSISFLPNSQVEVDFTIEEKSQQFIRQDAKVKISSDGLIGNKIIEVAGGTSTAPAVVDGFMFQVDKADSQQDIIKTLQENNKNILAITTDLKDVIRSISEGEGSIGKLLKDDKLYANLTTTMNGLEAASKQAQTITNSLNTFTTKLNKPGYLANDLVTNTTIVPNMVNTFAELQQTATKLKEASANANLLVMDLKKTTTNLLDDRESTVGVLLHDKTTASNFKSMVDNLESSSEKLDENMKALQSNILFRRYFKKKAKAEENNEVME
jgi:phospholipid/cholesterol/gamma-HCH transport system substrate-binding protein